jgi:hypothetical protein
MTKEIAWTEEWPGQRLFLSGTKGKRVAWVVKDGGVESCISEADFFDVPAFLVETAVGWGMGETPDEIAKAFARKAGMQVAHLATWPDLGAMALLLMPTGDLPELKLVRLSRTKPDPAVTEYVGGLMERAKAFGRNRRMGK